MGKLMIPNSRPKLTRGEAEQLVTKAGVSINSGQVVLLGVRGYYLDSMGAAGKNDIGVYDDAIFVLSPTVFRSFNGNTDPAKGGRKLAMLKTGVYNFYRGRHKGQYAALRAYPEGVKLPCTRDGVDSQCSFINIHKGGYSSTWSEGCQTVPTPQYQEFIDLVYSESKRLNQSVIPYVLTTN